MMNHRIQKFLSGLNIFLSLTDDEKITLAKQVSVRFFPKDTILATQGETKIENISIIKKGRLTLFNTKKGQQLPIGFIKPNEVFGGISILLNAGISLRTARVDIDTEIYNIPKRAFLDLCTLSKNFHEYFMANYSKNIVDESLASIIETGQVKNFLAHVDPFSFLPEDKIAKIASNLTMVQYPKGTILFIQGRSRLGYLYILQKGSAERYYEENNQKTMSGMVGEGDLYGGISILLNDEIAVRTLQVLEKSYFYLLPKTIFLDICIEYKAFQDYFTDTFGERMLEKSYAAIIAKTIQPKEEGLQFFNQPVDSIYSRAPILGDTAMPIQAAALVMQREKISSLFLNDTSGNCRGVVTERDMARKVTAPGYDVTRPVSDIMSSPVRMIHKRALIFEALMAMMEQDIRHLAVIGAQKNIVGILSYRDLLTAQGQSPLFLLREIIEAKSMDDIIDKHNKLPRLVRTLITSGAKAKNLTRFITRVTDAILEKLIGFTIDAMGPPPARFAFMILGSEGRNEQTLKTDQDNAIIYEDVSHQSDVAVNDYFLKFGEKVCFLLNQAGYNFCKGDIMAKNPKWCRPLSTWKKYFSDWIHAASPEDLFHASIFFDFRGGYGDMQLTDALRHYLFASLGGWSGFFRHLTENALYFKPPIGFFRNFVVESKGKNRDAFDIKSAMTPIVDLVRIYSIKNKIIATNTLERLEQLCLKKIFPRKEYEELEKAYSFLLQLRFVRQVTAVIDEKATPDNYIKPKKLTRIEQTTLKEIFRRIEKFQAKLKFDFTGTT